MSKKTLTSRQEAFAAAVAAGSSLADAYRKAYPKSCAWKPAAVHKRASEMMAKGEVSGRVQTLREAAASLAQVETAQVVQELARIALSDVRRLFDADGRIKRPDELDDATAAAVASIEFDAEGGFKVKLWDKNSAADKLMKHLGAYEKDNKQGGAGLAEAITLVVKGVKPDAA